MGRAALVRADHDRLGRADGRRPRRRGGVGRAARPLRRRDRRPARPAADDADLRRSPRAADARDPRPPPCRAADVPAAARARLRLRRLHCTLLRLAARAACGDRRLRGAARRGDGAAPGRHPPDARARADDSGPADRRDRRHERALRRRRDVPLLVRRRRGPRARRRPGRAGGGAPEPARRHPLRRARPAAAAVDGRDRGHRRHVERPLRVAAGARPDAVRRPAGGGRLALRRLRRRLPARERGRVPYRRARRQAPAREPGGPGAGPAALAAHAAGAGGSARRGDGALGAVQPDRRTPRWAR